MIFVFYHNDDLYSITCLSFIALTIREKRANDKAQMIYLVLWTKKVNCESFAFILDKCEKEFSLLVIAYYKLCRNVCKQGGIFKSYCP